MTGLHPLPGFVNSHSHAFQRALRGRAAGTDFWTWRDGMLEEADRATPDSVGAHYADVYREMRAAGYTAVGEFHYLGAAEAFAAAEAAADAGIAIVLLHVAYERGGLDRMRQPSRRRLPRRGRVAPRRRNRRRRRPPLRPRLLARRGSRRSARYAAREELPLHIHADEQPREIEECLEEHGCRPIELLADTGCLTARTTIIHATHANDDELDLLAATGARICACPTTEADLGDGFLRVADGARALDPALHRLGLEHADRPARGAPRARGDRAPPDRAGAGSSRPRSCSRSARPRARAPSSSTTWAAIEIDLGHRSLAGVAPEHVEAALIAGCAADVVVAGGA